MHDLDAVRRRPRSVINGRDPDALRVLLSFHAANSPRVLDVTANRRRMWRGLDGVNVVFSDADAAVRPDVVADFRRLPFADASFDVIVFDPPHLPAAAGSPRSRAQMVRDYGLDRGPRADGVHGLFGPFLLEAARVLRGDGVIFAKLKDFVHNHRYQWTLAEWVCAVRDVDGLTPCDLLVKNDPSGGSLKSGRWARAHHFRNAHCWWAVVRKGRCEPSASAPPASRAPRPTPRQAHIDFGEQRRADGARSQDDDEDGGQSRDE